MTNASPLLSPFPQKLSALTEPKWHRFHHQRQLWRIPRNIRPWLSDTGSLTARLVSASTHFHVEVLYEGVGRAYPSEVLDLNGAGTESERGTLTEPLKSTKRGWMRKMWIREVCLYCDDYASVVARTIIPLSSLKGANAFLKRLGNKPLGAALFSHPKLSRQRWAFAHVSAKQLPTGVNTRHVWARRSAFELNGSELLVGEYFLPPFFEKAH